MMINKKIILFLSLTALVLLSSCDDDDDDTIYGNWVEAYQFDGDKRSSAASFVIDETLYFGLGYNGSRSSGSQYFSDFSSYKGGTSWDVEAPFPGDTRKGAFAFAVGGKGYIGGGYYGDLTEIYYSDVWEFDPSADSAMQWTQIADFPGGERTDATSFVVGDVAYVTGGHYDSDATMKDCWKFNATTKTFEKASSMGYKRTGAFSFVIGDLAYVGGGYDNSLVKQLEVYDAANDVWNATELRDLYLPTSITDDISHYDNLLDLRRRWAVTFVIDGKGYLTSGNNFSILNDCWEYDPSTDLWTEKNDFQYNMAGRQGATAFTLSEDQDPFIMAGVSASGYLDDMWQFQPDEEADEND